MNGLQACGLQVCIYKLVKTNLFKVTCSHQFSQTKSDHTDKLLAQLSYFVLTTDEECEWIEFDNTSNSKLL